MTGLKFEIRAKYDKFRILRHFLYSMCNSHTTMSHSPESFICDDEVQHRNFSNGFLDCYQHNNVTYHVLVLPLIKYTICHSNCSGEAILK
jgi:hypothetical protein